MPDAGIPIEALQLYVQWNTRERGPAELCLEYEKAIFIPGGLSIGSLGDS
jgi:hypothetical protein